MSECPNKKRGGCPTLLGLMVTVVLTLIAAFGLTEASRMFLPVDGFAGKGVELAIVVGVILVAINALRSFRRRGN
ncbi:hypothetical protein [Hyphococcus sp.]|uniref:hypothetical protein n=1 Tax=Hyphococcus sp. TaxID=2038636 RepID=UPI00208A0FBA|nr:MAG: hypothetical protein DHS20C04_06050 [Marinicaulis sp.]